MKIKYEFVTETVEVEVSAEMYALNLELDRAEYNNNHKETRRHVSLNTGMDHSDWLCCLETDACYQCEAMERASEIKAAVKKLTPDQQHLIQKIFIEGMSIKDYAASCGVKPSAISHRISTIRKSLKKKLK